MTEELDQRRVNREFAQLKPDESRLTKNPYDNPQDRERDEDGYLSKYEIFEVGTKAQLAEDIEYERQIGLSLESDFLGANEIHDWSEEGMFHFRQEIIPAVERYCARLKGELTNKPEEV